MEPTIWIQLGIAGVTLYILREYLLRTDTRIDKRDEAYYKFVSDHNDKTAALMVQATKAIQESTHALKEISGVLHDVKEVIKK